MCIERQGTCCVLRTNRASGSESPPRRACMLALHSANSLDKVFPRDAAPLLLGTAALRWADQGTLKHPKSGAVPHSSWVPLRQTCQHGTHVLVSVPSRDWSICCRNCSYISVWADRRCEPVIPSSGLYQIFPAIGIPLPT